MKVNKIDADMYVNAVKKTQHTIVDKKRNITEYINNEVAYNVKISKEALKLLKESREIHKLLPNVSSKEPSWISRKG